MGEGAASCVRCIASQDAFLIFFSSPSHTAAYQDFLSIHVKSVHVIQKKTLIKSRLIKCKTMTVCDADDLLRSRTWDGNECCY